MRPARIAAAAAGSILLAGVGAGGPAVQAVAAPSAARSAARPPGPAVVIAPGVIHLARARQAPPTTAFCEQHFKIACYQPGQIEQAYRLPVLNRRGITGTGQTIVIVDSYGSPTVRHDLAVFDKAAGLPAPPLLRVIQAAGRVAPYRPPAGTRPAGPARPPRSSRASSPSPISWPGIRSG
jgi:hypothetical protein